MEVDEEQEQELRVKKDLAHLTRTLTRENLDPGVMFTKKRNIRSCTPAIRKDTEPETSVKERLKRVQVPE